MPIKAYSVSSACQFLIMFSKNWDGLVPSLARYSDEVSSVKGTFIALVGLVVHSYALILHEPNILTYCMGTYSFEYFTVSSYSKACSRSARGC